MVLERESGSKSESESEKGGGVAMDTPERTTIHITTTTPSPISKFEVIFFLSNLVQFSCLIHF